MTMNDRPHFVANGDIRPCRFVKHDTSIAAAAVLEADADERPIGISMEGTEQFPATGNSANAASAGKELDVHIIGDMCLLELGTGGATVDGLLKSDADGKGVAATADAEWVGAIALETGIAGEKIRVLPVLFQRAS